MKKKKRETEEYFFNTCQKEFQYLIDKFNCRVISKSLTNYSSTIIYKNNTTAIEISYEPREEYIFVLLMRLVDGVVPGYPIFIYQETKLHVFYLDDLLGIRNPSLIISRKLAGVPFTNSDIGKMLKRYALALRKYGSDILNGDFIIFSDLEKIVKRRAREIKN